MGLKPLGSLAVIYGLTASSSSLLFPLIFEATDQLNNSSLASFLGYLIFLIILSAIISTFVFPFLIIKEKIEKEKFACIIKYDENYLKYLEEYKINSSADMKGLLDLLNAERNKLKEIKLFPFEARMLLEIVTSILMPVAMLLLEKFFR